MSKKKQPWFPPPALPCTGVESHAHLDGKHFLNDLEEVLARARAAGVSQIGQIFLSPAAWAKHRERFAAHPEVFFLMGIHPTDAHEFTPDILDAVRETLRLDSRIKAVGEIGLDYYWKECPPATQKVFFADQLKMAREFHMPVVIHCRDAEEDTLAILKEEGLYGYPLLWHCFGGDRELAGRILDAGWHISVPGTVTFPSNTALREAVAFIPEDRLLVETDCPYLAPVPYRGKRNEPSYLGYTIQAIAEARKEPVDALWTRCGDNARRFFGL